MYPIPIRRFGSTRQTWRQIYFFAQPVNSVLSHDRPLAPLMARILYLEQIGITPFGNNGQIAISIVKSTQVIARDRRGYVVSARSRIGRGDQ